MYKKTVLVILLSFLVFSLAFGAKVEVNRIASNEITAGEVFNITFEINSQAAVEGFDLVEFIPRYWDVIDWYVSGYFRSDVSYEQRDYYYQGQIRNANHWRFEKGIERNVVLTAQVSQAESRGYEEFITVWLFPGAFDSEISRLSVLPSSLAYCGNKICDPGETISNCAVDCTVCGDGICNFPYENQITCNKDCPIEMWMIAVGVLMLLVIIAIIIKKRPKKKKKPFVMPGLPELPKISLPELKLPERSVKPKVPIMASKPETLKKPKKEKEPFLGIAFGAPKEKAKGATLEELRMYMKHGLRRGYKLGELKTKLKGKGADQHIKKIVNDKEILRLEKQIAKQKLKRPTEEDEVIKKLKGVVRDLSKEARAEKEKGRKAHKPKKEIKKIPKKKKKR